MNELTINGTGGVVISINQTALDKKRELIEASQLIQSVNLVTQNLCADALRGIKALIKSVEDCRKEVKAPVLKIGKEIDTKANEFSLELAQEANRLQGLLSAFQAVQAQIAQEAERKRQEELRKAEIERQKAEAEAQRKADEEAAKAGNEQGRLEAEHRKQQELEAIRKREEAAKATIQSVVPVVPKRAEGMIVKKVKKFRVVDAHALYLARPDLCDIQVSVSRVNAALRVEGTTSLPGIEVWEETEATVRAL